MRCSNCGHENIDQAKFCTGCGMKLTAETPVQEQYEQYQPDNEYRMDEDFGFPGCQSQEKKYEKKMVTIGIALAILVAVIGICAFLLYKHFTSSGDPQASNTTIAADPGTQATVTPGVTTMPIDTVTPIPSEVVPTETPVLATQTPEPTIIATPDPATVEYTATRVSVYTADLYNYTKAGVSQATASSTIVQEGVDNSASKICDGDEVSSWQEGVNGDGLGEYVTLNLDRQYEVKYMTFKLGNWRDDKNYNENNRPKTLTLQIGDESFQITFPDGKAEYCVQLNEPCPASSIRITIDSVYQGDLYDDTVIAEVGVYGK